MTPTPQDPVLTRESFPTTEIVEDLANDGNRVVISGMSGMFPKSHNVKELSDILYNKENPIESADLRWNFKHPETAQYIGIAPGFDLFDAQFFSVHYQLGQFIDPMARKVLEQTYQAIYDAGLAPAQLNGKKVGVFIGISGSETEKMLYAVDSRNGLGLLGTNKTMFANRISFWLNTKGPSLVFCETDCSSTIALEQAYSAMNRGDCEAAIVGGMFLCLHPQTTINFGRLSKCKMCKENKTKSFAQDADGYILSDAVSVLFLQKAKDALRVYSEIRHIKHEYSNFIEYGDAGPKFGLGRNYKETAEFIKQFYKEANVSPQAVEYVEAYGTVGMGVHGSNNILVDG